MPNILSEKNRQVNSKSIRRTEAQNLWNTQQVVQHLWSEKSEWTFQYDNLSSAHTADVLNDGLSFAYTIWKKEFNCIYIYIESIISQ